MAAMKLLFLLLAYVQGSPFDPHPLVRRPYGSFFDGWFLRVVDHAHNRSLAFVVGAYQPPSHPVAEYESSWMSIMVASADGSTVTEQTLAAGVTIVQSGGTAPPFAPDFTAPPRFEVSVPSILSLRVDGDEVELDASINGLRVEVHVAAPRVPWDATAPNGAGPEGVLRFAPSSLLPCHYFVHSLGSPSQYSVHRDDEGGADAMSGYGFAHLETNYGRLFPTAWVWAQGVDALGSTSLLVTGGAFVIAGVTTRTFIVAYRSPTVGELNFRSTDADSITIDRLDGCAGTFALQAAASVLSALWKSELRIDFTISADPASFSDPLFVPTSAGWSNSPGSVESFHARADVAVSSASKGAVETVALQLVALEFGGSYRCKAHGSDAMSADSDRDEL